MPLTLLLGGAGSGKSALAVRRAAAWGEGPVLFVATAEARDGEMAARIERHRAGRPQAWSTVEEPLDLRGALAGAPEQAFVVIDCLTLWTANALEAGWSDEQTERVAAEVADLAAARPSPTLVVSNEVGLGLVPPTPLGRRYRDVHARVNRLFAAAGQAYLVVAGRTLELS